MPDILRTNRALIPRARPGWWQNLGADGAGSLTFDTHPVTGRPRAVATWTVGASGGPRVHCQTAGTMTPVTPGELITGSLTVSKSAAINGRVGLYFSAGGVEIAWLDGGFEVNNNATAEQRFHFTAQTPAGAEVAGMWYIVGNSQPPGTIYLSDAMIETSTGPVGGTGNAGAPPTSYFDGDFPPGQDVYYQWTGPANESMSLELAGVPVPVGDVNVWHGSDWLPAPIMVRDGSNWTRYPVRHWNGSTWV